MKIILSILLFQLSFDLCDSIPEPIAHDLCDDLITVHFKNQHVNGCHLAPYFILENVTSDSLILTANGVTIIGGSLNQLTIKMLNCN